MNSEDPDENQENQGNLENQTNGEKPQEVFQTPHSAVNDSEVHISVDSTEKPKVEHETFSAGADVAYAKDQSTAVNAKDQANVIINQGEKVEIENLIQSAQADINKPTILVQKGEFKWPKQDEAPRIPFNILSQSYVDKLHDVFVSDNEYDVRVQTSLKTAVEQGERIFCIIGPEHSGRTTAAVNLGMEIFQLVKSSERSFYITSKVIESRDLLAFPSDSQVSDNAIYIFSNPFRNGVELGSLTKATLNSLQVALKEKKCFIILTSSLENHLHENMGLFTIPINVSGITLTTVFEKHIDWYRKQGITFIREELLNLISDHKEIVSGFKVPAQIGYFFDQVGRKEIDIALQRELPVQINLLDLQPEERIEKEKFALTQLARRAYRFGLLNQEPTRLWFERLPENARFLAMLSVLLEGAPAIWIEEVYSRAVHFLRGDGITTLYDPRQDGKDDLYSAIRARIADDGTLVFYSGSYVSEINEQIHNRHTLLWSLTDLIKDLIHEYKSSDFWEFRKSLGACIARMGVHHPVKLQIFLDALVKDESSGVVAVAGYILDELCSLGVVNYPFVLNRIDEWAKSGDPDDMWAASAAIWRVYDGLSHVARQHEVGQSTSEDKARVAISKLLEDLEFLSSNFDRFHTKVVRNLTEQATATVLRIELDKDKNNVGLHPTYEQGRRILEIVRSEIAVWVENNIGSILHAIRMMRLQNSEDVVNMIIPWINHADENLRVIGLLAGYQAFKENSNPKIQLMQEAHGPLLKLVSPLIETDSDTVEMVVTTLLVWLEKENWAESIQHTLLDTINHASLSGIEQLRRNLELFWLNSKSQDAQRIGKVLLSRCYVLYGSPIAMPQSLKALLAIDSSLFGRQKNISEIGRRIFARLDARIDTTVLAMGQSAPLATSGTCPQAEDLQPLSDRPRLLTRPIEQFHRDKGVEPDLVVALTYGPIIDDEDLFNDNNVTNVAQDWNQRLVFIRLGKSKQWENKNTLIQAILDTQEDYESLDLNLDAILGRILADTGYPFQYLDFHPSSSDLDTVSMKLESWLTSQDATYWPTDSMNGDPLRALLYGLLWLAKIDLARCMELLKSWLKKPEYEEGKSHNIVHCMALSAAGMLYTVFGNQKPPLPLAKLKPLIEFAPYYVIKAGRWKRIRPVIFAVRNWLEASMVDSQVDAWIATLHGKNSEKGENLFKAIAGAVPDSEKSSIFDLLNQWLAEKELPKPVRAVAEEILLRLIIGKGLDLPALENNRHYCLIIVGNEIYGKFEPVELADELYRAIVKRDEARPLFKPIIFRLGQINPLIVDIGALQDESGSSNNQAILSQSFSPAPLAIPILEKIKNVAEVGYLLLLNNDYPLDWDDREKNLIQIPFLKYPLDSEMPGWKEPTTNNAKAVASQIVEFIYQRSKGQLP